MNKLRKKAEEVKASGGGEGFLSKLRKKSAPQETDETPPSAPQASAPEPPEAVTAAPSAAMPPAAENSSPEPAPTPGRAEVTTPVASFFMSANDKQKLEYDGMRGELYKVFFRNLLFNILTLGLYHPWGKTNYRRYLWDRVSFDGDSFEYTGTGGELFKGMIIGSVMMLLLYGGGMAAVTTVGTMFGEAAGTWTGIGLFVVLGGFLTDLARFSARRYRYSRTIWRGVRLGVRGSAIRYGMYGLVQNLLTVATLGLYLPWAQSNKTARMTRATTLGAEHLDYDGSGRGLLKPWLLAWVLMIPTFGLVTFWYMARSQRYIAEHTMLQEARFASEVTGRKLFNLTYGNQMILSFTFGFGFPLVMQRNMIFLCENHSLQGKVDFGAIQQGARQKAGDAEGLSEVLDMGDTGFG